MSGYSARFKLVKFLQIVSVVGLGLPLVAGAVLLALRSPYLPSGPPGDPDSVCPLLFKVSFKQCFVLLHLLEHG